MSWPNISKMNQTLNYMVVIVEMTNNNVHNVYYISKFDYCPLAIQKILPFVRYPLNEGWDNLVNGIHTVGRFPLKWMTFAVRMVGILGVLVFFSIVTSTPVCSTGDTLNSYQVIHGHQQPHESNKVE